MKNKKSILGSAFDDVEHTPPLPENIGALLTKIGMRYTETPIIMKLIEFSLNHPHDVWVPQKVLASQCGTSRQMAAKALTHAINLNLIIVIQENVIPNPKTPKSLKDLSKHYDIRPLLKALVLTQYDLEPDSTPVEKIVIKTPKVRFGPKIKQADPKTLN